MYIANNAKYLFKTVGASVEDPDPDLQDPHVLGIPNQDSRTGYISQRYRYGSGSESFPFIVKV